MKQAPSALWLLIPAAVLAVFWPTLSAELVYDDWVNFDRNRALREGDWYAMVVEPYYGADTTYWRPITSLLMMLGVQLGGMPAVHVIAIATHIGAALVVGSIARQLLGDDRLARLAALLFALHPLVVESVAWASALPGVPSGLFTLLAVRATLGWAHATDRATADATGPRSWPIALWSLCAMLAKESGIVTIPIVVLVAFGSASRSRSQKLRLAGGNVLLGAVWFGVHVAVAGYRPVVSDNGGWLTGVAQMTLRELWLLLVPWPLTPFREPAVGTGSLAVDYGLVAIVAALLLALAATWRRLPLRWHTAAALIAVPLLFAAVTFDGVGPHPLTDRYLYLSTGGLALALTLALRRRAIVLIGLACVYGVVSAMQAFVWVDQRAFVTHVHAHGEGDPSVHVLAAELALQQGGGDGLQRARREYTRALELWPDRHDDFARLQRAAAIAGLAWCDFRDPGSPAERLGPSLVRRFERALEQDDEYVPAWIGLGVACGINGRAQDARTALLAAVTLDPMSPQAWFNLGRVQVDLGQRDAARDSLRNALRCDPNLRAAAELLDEL